MLLLLTMLAMLLLTASAGVLLTSAGVCQLTANWDEFHNEREQLAGEAMRVPPRSLAAREISPASVMCCCCQ